jgi:hypothetical protein
LTGQGYDVKRTLLTIAAVAALGVATAGTAQSASGLKCFGQESGSTCTSTKAGYELVVGTGQYAGVYIPGQGLNGKSLAGITSLQFNYTCDISGGSPRFTLSVIDGSGRDGWLFIDAASCNVGDNTASPSTGLVSPLVDASCAVSGYYWNSDNTTSGFYYTSWQNFLASSDGTSARFFSNNSFVIADQAGSVTVSNISVASKR